LSNGIALFGMFDPKSENQEAVKLSADRHGKVLELLSKTLVMKYTRQDPMRKMVGRIDRVVQQAERMQKDGVWNEKRSAALNKTIEEILEIGNEEIRKTGRPEPGIVNDTLKYFGLLSEDGGQ